MGFGVVCMRSRALVKEESVCVTLVLNPIDPFRMRDPRVRTLVAGRKLADDYRFPAQVRSRPLALWNVHEKGGGPLTSIESTLWRGCVCAWAGVWIKIRFSGAIAAPAARGCHQS